MDIKRVLKIIILYFLPVIAIHMIFAVMDLNIQNQKMDMEVMFQERRDVINIAVYFYFFIAPLYLALINVISHMNKKHELYTKDIKFIYLSIFLGGLCAYIFNINNAYRLIKSDLNPILEFFMVFITEGIMLGMLSFIGFLLIKNRMKRNTQENI